MTNLTALRSAFRATKDCAARQMGLRAIKDALALADRNPERVAELTAKAVHLLPYAEAAR